MFFASGNEGTSWTLKPLCVPCPIQTSGFYKIGVRAFAATTINGAANLLFDRVRLLATNGYTHLWHEDLEAGASGWTFTHGGGITNDWSRTTTLFGDIQFWSGSDWSLKSPDFSSQNIAAWAEAQTPEIWIPQGTSFVSLMTLHYPADRKLEGQVRLLGTDGQLLQTLYDDRWTNSAYLGTPLAYPASYSTSIAVGACTDLDRRSFYSRFGTGLFCVAPSLGGWNMIATTDTRGTAGANDGTWSDGDYRLDFGGTSAATPLTAGIAALLLSKNATVPLGQLKINLRLGCDQIGGVSYGGTPPWHQEYGYGRINAHSSLNITAADTTPPIVASVIAKTGRAVEVTFSEQMGTGVTSPTLYTISGSGKGTLATKPASVTWVSGNTFLLEWTVGEMIAGTGNITITVATTVRDIAGNGMGNPRTGNANGSRVIHAVSCGRRAPASLPIAPFESDRYWSGAGGPQEGDGVIQFLNDDGTPIGVVSTYRGIFGAYTSPGDIIYSLPGISSGVNHEVRLYFYNSGQCYYPGDIKFDIHINNVLKYSNLDLVLESGGSFNAFWKSFSNITASSGAITVRIVPKLTFNQTWVYNCYSATLSGIKIAAQ